MGKADSKYIDVAAGLPRLMNNEDLYKKLIAKFGVDIDAMNAALAEGDYNKAGEIVHAAKGVAANLSLTAFYDSSVILMDQLRGGNKPDGQNVDNFIKLYGETIAAIEEYLA
jgi:HPt (histidine-containing phosphotransfer) domain-containing protein